MRSWWKEAIGYQIYPRSFFDSNGDGIGDLAGITSKLDYLQKLGVNLLWLCPFFKSPMDDNGYDISDHYHVDPSFGSDEDLRTLIDEVHRRDMKIIFDFVLNHTSDEHPWFIEARNNPQSEAHQYYIWHPGKFDKTGKRHRPNNWRGFFADSAWKFDRKAGQYYMKIFSKKMPDLNWENPLLRQKIYEVAHHYLSLGVDGFRLDAIAHLARDTTFSDSTYKTHPDGTVLDYRKFSNLPRLYDYLAEFKKEVLDHYDCVSIGEVGGGASTNEALRYSGYEQGSINMVFNFDTCWENGGFGNETARDEDLKTNVKNMKAIFKKWYDACDQKAWLPIYWLNHDHPRVVSQYGHIKYRYESATMLATVLLFMYGTPFIYNGEEIGMSNVDYQKLEDFKDVSALNYANDARKRRTPEEILRFLRRTSRINARTPMQWSAEPFAGFSTVEPLTKVNGNYQAVNVQSQEDDPNSILNYYRKAIALRKEPQILNLVLDGHFDLLDLDHEDVFAYVHQGNPRLVVIANFRKEIVTYPYSYGDKEHQILLANYIDRKEVTSPLKLRPFEALVMLIQTES